VRLEQAPGSAPANFLVGVAPAGMDLSASIGQEGCGIGLDYYGYVYVNGRYFHVSNLANWQAVAKPVRGSTARHKGKAGPMFTFVEGRLEITLTLDLKEGTLRFSSGGHSIGTIANVAGPVHAALTLTSPRQTAAIAPGPIGKMEHTAEELVNILKAKGHLSNPRAEAAMLVVPRDLFVPRDRDREAFRCAPRRLWLGAGRVGAEGSGLCVAPVWVPSLAAAPRSFCHSSDRVTPSRPQPLLLPTPTGTRRSPCARPTAVRSRCRRPASLRPRSKRWTWPRARPSWTSAVAAAT
jgi:hypothetical protein